jgi:hypothetical protein
MPLIQSVYTSPRWLPGAHAQTIFAARCVPRPKVSYRRERWDCPDGDFIDLDFALPEPALLDAPVLALFHGLEGCSRSHYALALMRAAADHGWRGVVVHFRSCSGELNRLPRAYHSGDSDEIDWILRKLAVRHAPAPLYAVGVSLGGNALAKWLGERGADASFVSAAASIGAPLDLAAGGAALARGFNRIYSEMFLRTMKAKALDKARLFPDVVRAERIQRCRSLYDFDNEYTAPVHGFKNTEDYWKRASGKPWLRGVAVPHLVLNALNDPFVPAASLPHEHEISRCVHLEQPPYGGHIGFPSGPPPGKLDFLPQRVFEFFTRGS